MSVFWKKEEKKLDVKEELKDAEVMKKFLKDADGEFIKCYCFPAFLACAYYFGTNDTKLEIERLIDEVAK